MELFRAPTELRIFFAVSGLILWLGLWHTGFGAASWILYVPALFFPFAALSGICPGLGLARLLTIRLRGADRDDIAAH
ncbi:MAG: hypothetical protein GWP66_03220 [Gammaproteobacteria bacterium]|jgi:hypothetical protein|nr:hypothetical protein [Gammaproteobacteria bacterium]